MQTQLHISRVALSSQCAIYNWACREESEAVASGTANTIEASLVAAVNVLTCHSNELGNVEILYRDVALGSFSVNKLDSCAAEVADLIEERYEQTRMHA